MNNRWPYATIPMPSRADSPMRWTAAASVTCPRIDLLVDNGDGTGRYYRGIPSHAPVPPLIPADARDAARITVPAMGAGDPTVLWLNTALRRGKYRYSPSAAPPDSWDMIVGIPLDDWMQAQTTADVDALIDRRDARTA